MKIGGGGLAKMQKWHYYQHGHSCQSKLIWEFTPAWIWGGELAIMWAMTKYVKSWLFNKLLARVSPIDYILTCGWRLRALGRAPIFWNEKSE